MDGTHEGELDAAGGTVSVGSGGRLSVARGRVGQLVVQGKCKGALVVEAGVEVLVGGELVGRVQSGWMDVEEGAVVDGDLDVGGIPEGV